MKWAAYVAAAGKATLPVFWFLFSLRFLDTKAWYRSLSLPVILLSPVVFIGLHGRFPLGVSLYAYGLLSFGLLIFGNTMIRKGKVPLSLCLLLVSAGLVAAGLRVLSLVHGVWSHLEFTSLGILVFFCLVIGVLFQLNRLIVDSSVRHHYFESSHDGIVVFNKRGRIIDINPATIRLGLDPDSLLGKKFAEVFGQASHEDRDTFPNFEFSKNECVFDVGISPLKRGKKKGGIAVFRDITARQNHEKELERYATMDILTGSYNRRMGLTILEQQLRFAERNGTHLTLCFVDINDLKIVNDNFGHAEGDTYIRTVADIIKTTFRDSDVLCRLGGDEFLIILPDCSKSKASRVWDRFEETLYAEHRKEEKPYPFGVARGFAEFTPGSGRSADDLLSEADADMYRNKVVMKSSGGKLNA